ncbi:NUDIX hydrolase [Ectobacillus antri]|jgi:coenzyme A diphosphatase NUDT7|uniref:NUDIX hydrolase n=1 Tax=Ectobacillus antri TaxID=2486280 RepID=UPI000F5B3417|nr:CoA pyrophosphatase [Ectobacillus antri]
MDTRKILTALQTRTPSILGSEQFTKFAILLPLIQKENELHILFEVRSATLRRQPGEICFPGGKIDASDETPQHAAMRETTEELGIPTDAISQIVPLDYMISPFGSIIYPYTGLIDSSYELIPNAAEVESTFTVPLPQLLRQIPDVYRVQYKVEPGSDFPYELIPGGESYNWQTRGMKEYFYHYKGYVIWGLTARVLKHFLDITRKLNV